MFIHSAAALGKFNQLKPEQIQPNAVDLTLGELLEYDTSLQFKLSNEETVHVPTVAAKYSWYESYHLKRGQAYSFRSNEYVEMPPNTVGWVIARSSLNRNGLFCMSGLYDSGFKGNVAGTLYAFNDALIKPNVRFAQFVMANAEAYHEYNGQYQGK